MNQKRGVVTNLVLKRAGIHVIKTYDWHSISPTRRHFYVYLLLLLIALAMHALSGK